MKRSGNERQFIPTDHAMECPFCGSNRLVVLDTDDTYWISCSECDANGPSGKSAAEALDRWNWLGHK